MVQGKDIKIETDDNKKTTLTIVQEFPKAKAEHTPAHSVDFVQANEKGKDIKIETDDNKKTTLTIVQEFPKKSAKEHQHGSIEMVQSNVIHNHPAEFLIKNLTARAQAAEPKK